MEFYLGTHRYPWLNHSTIPLFISDRVIKALKSFPQAQNKWALDSGAFTELKTNGQWLTTPREYIKRAKRYSEYIGKLALVAPQDWMCEPFMLKKTGLTIQEHQHRTIENYLELKNLDSDLPILPVLQGWTLSDYLSHIDLYLTAGIDLTTENTVGIGSVCRRQSTKEIRDIVASVASMGIALHGFGVKYDGLNLYKNYLASADSMAWSLIGRYHRIEGHEFEHPNCANCLDFALNWRNKILGLPSAPILPIVKPRYTFQAEGLIEQFLESNLKAVKIENYEGPISAIVRAAKNKVEVLNKGTNGIYLRRFV